MPKLEQFTLPRIPESPVFETNRELEQLVAHIESMRPVVADCATMIKSMNDAAIQMQANFMANSVKAEKQSRFATWFAVGGLFISVLAMVISTVFSYVGFLDNRESGKRNEGQATLTSQTIKSLADSAKKDQTSFVEALREERRVTFEAKNKARCAPRQTDTAKTVRRGNILYCANIFWY